MERGGGTRGILKNDGIGRRTEKEKKGGERWRNTRYREERRNWQKNEEGEKGQRGMVQQEVLGRSKELAKERRRNREMEKEKKGG